jgi:hypothetical protein
VPVHEESAEQDEESSIEGELSSDNSSSEDEDDSSDSGSDSSSNAGGVKMEKDTLAGIIKDSLGENCTDTIIEKILIALAIEGKENLWDLENFQKIIMEQQEVLKSLENQFAKA